MKRHLAAILAADVAGFSRIMADDETATFAAMKSCLTEVVEPCISQHGGRIFKSLGSFSCAQLIVPYTRNL
jgi:adenylate cyclase